MHFDIDTLAPAIISAVATYYIFTKESKNPIVYERYDKLLFPVFDLLEPYLYKELTDETRITLKLAYNIFEQNKKYAGYKFCERIEFCFPVEKCTKENFFYFCDYLNRDFDLCCRKIGLKPRSIWYRLNKKQYKNKYLFGLRLLLLAFLMLVCQLIAFVVITFLLYVLQIVILSTIIKL